VTEPDAAARWSLLADGSLGLQVDPRLRSAAETWVPLHTPPLGASATAAATIDVRYGGSPAPGPRLGPPTLRLGDVEARVDDAGGHVSLVGSSGVSGTVDLEARRSEILATDLGPATAADLYSMLTVTSAFLLGRLDRALVHAAAVLQPAGGAWLLVGDARAGKTTTGLNLVTSGWDYLSDDQVVLSLERDGSLSAEGWLRPFHVDAGWAAGTRGERRESVDPSSVGPGRWQRQATLAGTFVLDLRPASLTKVEALSHAEVFAAIVRQTPWLLADSGKATTVLALLVAVTQRPAFRLCLGSDTYRDGARLLQCLQPVLAGG
jgi:hypothetical protein